MHLQVQQLSKVYPGERGLLPLTVSVERGELIAIVGHNGAGKSTFLKMLASWIKPDGGSVLVDGVALADRMACVHKIGFVPEAPNLYELFSVSYNLTLFARLFGLPSTRVDDILGEFDLLRCRRTRVQALSKGLKQRLSLARSLLPDPALVLLDEPTSGLDFAMTKEFYRRLEAVHRGGKTILFTSHRPEELRMLATRILVLHAGRLVFDGRPDAYFASQAHQDLYQ